MSERLSNLKTQIDRDGFAIVPDVLSAASVASIIELIETARSQQRAESVSNSSDTYGMRNLTDVVPSLKDLLRTASLAKLVEAILGSNPFMVRATLFDKTPDANWGVFWHQDLSIAVAERHEVEGFSAWTRKAGVHSVQPPMELMQQLIAVRLHLDDCLKTNGALKVLKGTHRLGRLQSAEVDASRGEQTEVVCEVPVGGALLMRPTLLHASSPMEEPTSRRVIHFEFAAFELPNPLQWRYRIPTGTSNTNTNQEPMP
jgi:ectoine hydroxylase-related dioxygenase (phytanoyl-CoA dioxygenase family)